MDELRRHRNQHGVHFPGQSSRGNDDKPKELMRSSASCWLLSLQTKLEISPVTVEQPIELQHSVEDAGSLKARTASLEELADTF